MFLDVSQFLAASTSLDKWLKAYKCKVQKAIIPFEWLDDYNKLMILYYLNMIHSYHH
jgi:hypothetical protein